MRPADTAWGCVCALAAAPRTLQMVQTVSLVTTVNPHRTVRETSENPEPHRAEISGGAKPCTEPWKTSPLVTVLRSPCATLR